LGLALSIRNWFQKWFGEKVILDLGPTWKAAAVAVSLMSLAGLYPAILAANQPPLRAVKDHLTWHQGRKMKRTDVRLLLAIAAVAIGVAGIVVMSGNSYLTQEKIEAYLRSVGERLVLIESDTERIFLHEDSPEVPPSNQSNPPLLLHPALVDSLPAATGAYRGAWFQDITTTAAVPGSNEVHTVSVVACSPAFVSIRRFPLASGRFLQHQDDRDLVCVLGHRIAKSLFGEEDCLGKQCRPAVPFRSPL
jgi:ABC-type lipoprotein release transport system permease subunit